MGSRGAAPAHGDRGRASRRLASRTAMSIPPSGKRCSWPGMTAIFASVARRGPSIPLEVRRVPGWRTVDVDHGGQMVHVPRGVNLDLGATAKALAADRAAQAVHDAVGGGVLVSLGGDLAIAGPAPSGGWCVRVTDDHASDLGLAGEDVVLDSGGLATSSTTVRCWTAGRPGAPSHHRPRHRMLQRYCWRTVSVAAANCVDANTASTAAIVRGEAAAQWLESLGMPARLVRHDGTVMHVGGWATEAES